LLEPDVKESVIGSAEVRQIFECSKGVPVAGCMVSSGRIVKGKVARAPAQGRHLRRHRAIASPVSGRGQRSARRHGMRHSHRGATANSRWVIPSNRYFDRKKSRQNYENQAPGSRIWVLGERPDAQTPGPRRQTPEARPQLSCIPSDSSARARTFEGSEIGEGRPPRISRQRSRA